RWFQRQPGKWMLAMLPLHGRGNQNGEGEDAMMLLYERPDDPRGKWPTHQVSTSNLNHNFDVIHHDKEGDALLVASRLGLNVYSTVLVPTEIEWCGRYVMSAAEVNGKRVGTPEFKGAGEVRIGKLGTGEDSFFISTVEPMHGNQLVVYSPPWPKEIPY